ncbi:MAG: murein biosynthesis integral membrane protein MurJ [Magnetovibrionaceae bacterium]
MRTNAKTGSFSLIRAFATVGSMTLLSRLLGFVRDVLVAGVLGAGPIADAFFVAFKFPNLFRRLFAEGAFNLAFVPLFAGKLEARGLGPAMRFADGALSLLALVLVIFVALGQVLMPWAMMGFAPGFTDDPATFDLAVLLTRITLPYLLFISLVSLMAGVLNSLGRFWAAAATPVLLNLCLIGAVLILAPQLPTPAHALAWGVAGAGAVQFLWMIGHLAHAGASLRLPWPRLDADQKVLLKRCVPVAIGAGIYQINLVIDTVIASLLPGGSISYLFFADRVTQLPLGVIGVAVGTALLPLLSRQIRAGDEAGALASQNRALEVSFLFTLPAAVALFLIAEPVILTLFQRGAFGIDEARATAAALGIYALGLPAYVLVKALAPGFYAREDTRRPVIAAAAAMVVNLGLNLILMGPFQHVGIAMATVASSWLNAGLLAYWLSRRGQLQLDARLKNRLPRMILAALVMGAGLFGLMQVIGAWFDGGEADRIAGMSILVVLGLALYGLAAQLTGAAGLRDIKGLVRGKT